MSRSRRPQCSTGRGCGCCGDAGEARRKREQSAEHAYDRDMQVDGADARQPR